MPLVGTFGAAASKGFGQTRGGRGPYDIEYMVAAGGAGGSAISGGSGGAGGLQVFTSVEVAPEDTFAVSIGGGGAGGSNNKGSDGTPTSFGPQSSTGGGKGGYEPSRNGTPGGSGGAATVHGGSGGSGTPGQGNPGGPGGGGGKNGSGGPHSGGADYPYPITGNSYADGGNYNDNSSTPQPANSAKGGPGKGQGGTGGSGGSGIVVVSYSGDQVGTGGTVSSQGGNTLHTFTGPGTYTA